MAFARTKQVIAKVRKGTDYALYGTRERHRNAIGMAYKFGFLPENPKKIQSMLKKLEKWRRSVEVRLEAARTKKEKGKRVSSLTITDYEQELQRTSILMRELEKRLKMSSEEKALTKAFERIAMADPYRKTR